jgi:hypothetical protein
VLDSNAFVAAVYEVVAARCRNSGGLVSCVVLLDTAMRFGSGSSGGGASDGGGNKFLAGLVDGWWWRWLVEASTETGDFVANAVSGMPLLSCI